MEIINLEKKDTASTALRNFALAISSKQTFEDSFVAGMDFIDTKVEEVEYLTMLSKWKSNLLKVEVSKMICDKKENIKRWEIVLI